jgi:hypothetical protein
MSRVDDSRLPPHRPQVDTQVQFKPTVEALDRLSDCQCPPRPRPTHHPAPNGWQRRKQRRNHLHLRLLSTEHKWQLSTICRPELVCMSTIIKVESRLGSQFRRQATQYGPFQPQNASLIIALLGPNRNMGEVAARGERHAEDMISFYRDRLSQHAAIMELGRGGRYYSPCAITLCNSPPRHNKQISSQTRTSFLLASLFSPSASNSGLTLINHRPPCRFSSSSHKGLTPARKI